MPYVYLIWQQAHGYKYKLYRPLTPRSPISHSDFTFQAAYHILQIRWQNAKPYHIVCLFVVVPAVVDRPWRCHEVKSAFDHLQEMRERRSGGVYRTPRSSPAPLYIRSRCPTAATNMRPDSTSSVSARGAPHSAAVASLAPRTCKSHAGDPHTHQWEGIEHLV